MERDQHLILLEDMIKKYLRQKNRNSYGYLIHRLGWHKSHLYDILKGKRKVNLIKSIEILTLIEASQGESRKYFHHWMKGQLPEERSSEIIDSIFEIGTSELP